MGLGHYKQMRDFMATNKRKDRWKDSDEEDEKIVVVKDDDELFEEDEFVSEDSDEPIN